MSLRSNARFPFFFLARGVFSSSPKAQTFFSFHATWVTCLILGLSLSFGLYETGRLLINHETASLQTLRKERETARTKRRLVEEDVRRAKEIEATLTPLQREKLLRPANRRAFTAALEEKAKQYRLAPFTFTLSAPEKDAANATQTAKLTLEADAPLDTDLLSFLNTLQDSTPGKLIWSGLKITRPPSKSAAVLLPLHVSAEALWLAPAAFQSIQGQPTP